MAKGWLVNRELLHRFLWKHADRAHVLPWTQQNLGEVLNINPTHMNTIFKEFLNENKIVKQGKRWRITDPADFYTDT